MEINKLIVIDTCALLPNCLGKSDSLFDVKKWIDFLEEKEGKVELAITPFTLYEILSIKSTEAKEKLIKYLIKNSFEVIEYRIFRGMRNFRLSSDLIGREMECRQLITFEINRILTNLVLNFILITPEIASKLNQDNLQPMTDKLNDFSVSDDKAKQKIDLKMWFENEFFDDFFKRISDILQTTLGYEISYADLEKKLIGKAVGRQSSHCINDPDIKDSYKMYGEYPFFNTQPDDMFFSQHILKMFALENRKFKMINYMVDAMNVYSAFQNKNDFFFVTRDEDAIKLIFDAKKHGLKISEGEEDFILRFIKEDQREFFLAQLNNAN